MINSHRYFGVNKLHHKIGLQRKKLILILDSNLNIIEIRLAASI